MSQFNDLPNVGAGGVEGEPTVEAVIPPELQSEMERPVSPEEVETLFQNCVDRLVNAKRSVGEVA